MRRLVEWIRRRTAGRATHLLLGAGLVLLVLTLGLPHRHSDHADAFDSSHQCQLCKIHHSASPITPSVADALPAQITVLARVQSVHQVPRAAAVRTFAASRAPPRLA